MTNRSMMLLVASAALIASSPLAAPQLPVRPPVISPVTGNQPIPADYPLEIPCKPKVSVDVQSYDVPPGWTSIGQPGEYQGSGIRKSSIVEGKDEMHCDYFMQTHPNITLATLRFFAAMGSCIDNPNKPGFRCRSGTVPSTK